jgi:hypothetical protein
MPVKLNSLPFQGSRFRVKTTGIPYAVKNMPSSSSSSLSSILSGYRRLLRAREQLFRNDHEAMIKSRVAIQQEFRKQPSSSTDVPIQTSLRMIDEAIHMLTHGIVRGDLNHTTGHYGTAHH